MPPIPLVPPLPPRIPEARPPDPEEFDGQSHTIWRESVVDVRLLPNPDRLSEALDHILVDQRS